MLKWESFLQPITEQKSALKEYSFLTGLTKGLISILLLSGLLLLISPRSRWQEQTPVTDHSLSLTNSLFLEFGDRLSPQQLSALRELVNTESTRNRQNQVSELDLARARYLLAQDSLQKKQFSQALTDLAGLETIYPVLAPYILLKKVEAYQQMQQPQNVKTVAQQIIDNYPDSSVIPELLALLKRHSPEDLAYLRANFPYHPRIQQIARQQIKKNPQHWQSLLLIATYNRGTQINPIRDRLVLDHPAQLTKEDWQVIADGYWRSGDHRKAADAYQLSLPSPQNLYRTARGFHRNGNFAEARVAYQRLIREYHDAYETGEALLYLARLSAADEAIAYLDRAITDFPHLIPQALLDKAKIYERFDKTQEANLARQQVLKDYPDSVAALNYLWQKAYQLAIQGDYTGAWQWGKAISQTQSVNSDPKAIFWVGKWAKQAGKTEAANQAFQKILALHPQSYYAWRAAVMLGQDVGDFDNLRSIKPNLVFEPHYEPLPMGSDTLQELYLLGQYQDAWIQLQAEITHPQELTVSEQFSEGLLLVKQGKLRPGIQNIWDLAQRESPQEQQTWRSLRAKDSYWYGLFPFPYQEAILNNAQQEAINPLLAISVMRKESTFDPEIDSHVGAVGLMQVIPRTASWIAQQTDITAYDLTKPEDNIRLGTWYLAHNHQRYENNSLYAIASYNAGTGNVNQWLKQLSTGDSDLFVEQIPFKETKDYVEGVFANYWNYLRLYDAQYQTKK